MRPLSEVMSAFGSLPGRAKNPLEFPAARIIVPYEASRAASAAVCPARSAICVTEAGTYTDPAHNPMMETKTSSALTMVRRAYAAENTGSTTAAPAPPNS